MEGDAETDPDPFGIGKNCQISSSQERILSLSHFAREDEFPPSSPSTNSWPVFSDSCPSPPRPSNALKITICSPPDTPQSARTPHSDVFKTPPEVAAASGSDDDGVNADSSHLGFSGSTGKIRREREFEIPPSEKKSKGSDNLGFPEPAEPLEDTVVLVTDDDGEEVGNGGYTEVVNDVDRREKSEARPEKEDDGKGKLKLETNSNAEGSKEDAMDLMKILVETLKKLSGANRKSEEDEDDDEHVDIIKTAMKRGMTFPRSRFYDRK